MIAAGRPSVALPWSRSDSHRLKPVVNGMSSRYGAGNGNLDVAKAAQDSLVVQCPAAGSPCRLPQAILCRNHGGQRLLGHPARLQEGREVGATAQFWDA